MKRFIEGQDRNQSTLLPDCIEDYVEGDNPVRAVDAFIDMLDLATLGFNVEPEATGRPGYHPATMLKLYLYGYLNQVQSSRRLEAAGTLVWNRMRPLTRHFLPADTFARALGLGALWGWLPCGMVYAVLVTAVAISLAPKCLAADTENQSQQVQSAAADRLSRLVRPT